MKIPYVIDNQVHTMDDILKDLAAGRVPRWKSTTR